MRVRWANLLKTKEVGVVLRVHLGIAALHVVKLLAGPGRLLTVLLGVKHAKLAQMAKPPKILPIWFVLHAQTARSFHFCKTDASIAEVEITIRFIQHH